MAAQHAQAVVTGRPDVFNGDAQLGTDLGVGHGGIFDKQNDQLLTARGKLGECVAQRGVALCYSQLMLDHAGRDVRNGFGIIARQTFGVQRGPCARRRPHRAPGPAAFPHGRAGQPAAKRGRSTELVKLAGELQPDELADVAGAGVAEPVLAADGSHQRGVPLDEGVPRLLIVVPCARHQVSD